MKKKNWEHDHFLGDGINHLTPKMNIIFYHELDAEYFHIKQFFRKKPYFL